MLGHQHARRAARLRPAHRHNGHLPEKMRVISYLPTQQVMKTNNQKDKPLSALTALVFSPLPGSPTSASPVISEQDANEIAVGAYIHLFPLV